MAGGNHGVSLDPVSDALTRGPVPLSQAVKIVDRVCEILGAMHVAGRVHGAVHAESVRFHHVGGVLEVALDPGGEAPPTYVPPEQTLGHAPTARGDVYQVGVLLYHLIDGSPPFDGATDDDIRRKHQTVAPKSLAAHPLQDVPLELDKLLMSMLAKNPGARPRSVEAIRSRLSNLELDSTVMGMRLDALRNVAVELGSSAPVDIPEDVPTRLQKLQIATEEDATIPPEPVVSRPPIQPSVVPAQPHDTSGVDPFADTFIRNRSEFDLDGDDETQMTLPPERHDSSPSPQVVQRAPVKEPPTGESARLDVSPTSLARSAPSQLSTAAAVMIGLAVFVVTLVVILWLAG